MIPDVPRLSRRSVVAMAAVAVSAGCSGGGDGTADGAGHKATEPAPGVLARQQAARDSAALLVRYDTVAAQHPSLAARLAPLRAEVALHVGAFGGRPAPAPTAAPTSVPTDTPTDAPTAPPSPSPTSGSSKSAALKSLADAERRLADSRALALLDAPGELARLFASAAAAGAGHVALLGKKGITG